MPPTISRQTPSKPAPPLPQFAAGSMLATAVPVTSLAEECVVVGLYGRNRAGKTTLAAQFPKPLLFVSCEPANCGGVQSVSNMQQVTLLQFEDARDPREKRIQEKLAALGEELATDTYYRTVVLKTATSLQDCILEEMRREMGGTLPTGRSALRDVYGVRAIKLHDGMRAILDLKKRNKHVVVIAQEKDHNPPLGEGGFPDLKAKLLQTMQQGSFMAPCLGASNAQWMYDNCGYLMQIYEDEVMQDTVIRMNNPDRTPAEPRIERMGTGVRQRHLRLKYHANFAAGGKWQYDPNLPEFVTAPDPIGLYKAMAAYIPALRK